MPRAFAGIDPRGVKDPVAAQLFREIDRFLRTTALGNFGDFESKEDGAGVVCNVGGRRFRLRIAASGELTGGGEIQLSATGAITGARDTGATGILIVKVEDLGT